MCRVKDLEALRPKQGVFRYAVCSGLGGPSGLREPTEETTEKSVRAGGDRRHQKKIKAF